MAIPVAVPAFSTANTPTSNIGDQVDQMMTFVKGRRTSFERKWYDNNFFDDGYHYRFFSRVANKIVDVSDRATVYSPMRAIPKASRQIRGIANLLVAPDYIPVIYPEKIDGNQTPKTIPGQDPNTGQPIQQPNPAYEQKMQESEDNAHKVSRWVLKEWDVQEMIEKIAFMVILSAKHGVSYMQVWPDAENEAIKTQVYDAFDIYLPGELTSIYDAPFIIKASPMLISQIKANPNFDQDQLAKISPDNKFASSDIKQAYMSTRFNQMGSTDAAATLILKEAYIKEYLNSENMAKIQAQDDSKQILDGRDEGDTVIRQVFVAGNIWLRDRYLSIPDYPFVDFRFEPGPIYQVPLIERFIPINKSLDNLVSRAERYSHTMVTGSWSIKTGESTDITNDAGGQILKYTTTPPVQNQIASIPQFFFELMNMMGSLIEEQGTSTSTLGKLPTGVKAHSAIESLKESEYANLVIASRRLKGTVKRICEKMLDIADVHYITPQTVYDMEKGKPNYFDVIGNSALKGRKKLKVETPNDVIPLKKDYKCEIEVQEGMSYTQEGRKQSAKELSEFMVQMAQAQLLSPDVVKAFVEQLLKTYRFGDTEDIMEALNQPDMTNELNEQQLTQMKVAVLEALKDAGEVGPEAQQSRLMENKVGVLEALHESGLVDKLNGPQAPQGKQISESLSYKDAPPSIQRQIEAQAGLNPAFGEDTPQQVDQKIKATSAVLTHHQGQQKAGIAQQQADTQTHSALSQSNVSQQQTDIQRHTAMHPPKLQRGGSNGSKSKR